MKVMVFDVGGTEIKYSVMDEQLNRADAGSVPTPDDTQEHLSRHAGGALSPPRGGGGRHCHEPARLH